MKLIKSLLISIIFCITVSGILMAGYEVERERVQNKIKSQQEELTNLKKEIGEYKKSVRALSRREKQLNENIKKLREEFNKKEKELNGIRKNIELTKEEITEIKIKLSNEKKEGGIYSSFLQEALKNYYIKVMTNYKSSWVDIFLGVSEENYFMAGKLVGIPAQRYTEIKKEIKRTTNLKENLHHKKQNHIKLKEQVVEIQKISIARSREHLNLLKKTSRERQKHQTELNRMETEKDKLNTLIMSLKVRAKNLERLKLLADNLIKAKGYIPWPVQGTVTTKFGRQKHAHLDTFIYNRGIRIKPSSLSDRYIQVVAGGEIVYADNFTGLGLMVVVDHGKNYYTIYAGLKEIYVEIGQEVEPFHKIGKISNEGLYFEIGQDSIPQNPLLWLEKR